MDYPKRSKIRLQKDEDSFANEKSETTTNMARRQLWSEDQDDAIRKLVAKHGTKKWAIIAKYLEEEYGVIGRSGKQIRERWNNHLNPDINKGPITLDEGIKIFDAHRRFGNKWAEITTMLPGRTDNTVKNYFYATVRRHLRKLNKCLRAPKFCEAFNIEPKQVKVNFLIDALELGNLNFFEISAIENKELIVLSKKKTGNYNKKMTSEEKELLPTLDGKGKPIDKNLKLLKELLTLVNCDLEKQHLGDEDDEESSEEIKSFSIKNETAKEVISEPKISTNANKRFKKLEIETFEEEKEEEEKKEEKEDTESDGVNFHEIPEIPPPKQLDFSNKQDRIKIYENIYQKRREQKRLGRCKPVLSNYCKLIFSYPKFKEIEENISRPYEFKNEITFDNAKRCPSSISFLSEMKSEARQPSFAPSIKIETDNGKYQDINNDNPGYELKNDIFTYEINNSQQNSCKNSTKTADFCFKMNPVKSPAYQREFQFQTYALTNALNTIKPLASPSTPYNENMFYFQTPVRTPQNNFGMFSSKNVHVNPAQNFKKIFMTDAQADNNNVTDVVKGDNDNSKSVNDGSYESKPLAKFQTKKLELDMDIIGNDAFPSAGLFQPSPLNFPISCNSNGPFLPNTPHEHRFIDSTTNAQLVFDSSRNGKGLIVSPNSGFSAFKKSEFSRKNQ